MTKRSAGPISRPAAAPGAVVPPGAVVAPAAARAAAVSAPAVAMTWVFGYGSLMWNPGFPCVEKRPAVLRGYHRAYMMYSTRNRGTPDCPGMVLSLAPGGACIGRALCIEPGKEAEALDYLDQREGLNRAHKRVLVPIHWHTAPAPAGNGSAPAATPGVVHVWTYLPILTYSNYIWGVPIARQAELVARGQGATGTSYDYLRQVMQELEQLQVTEPTLDRLHREASRCRDAGICPATTLGAE